MNIKLLYSFLKLKIKILFTLEICKLLEKMLEPVLVFGIKEINIDMYIDIDFLKEEGMEIYTMNVKDNVGEVYVYGSQTVKQINGYKIDENCKNNIYDFCEKYGLENPEFFLCIKGDWEIPDLYKNYIPDIPTITTTESFLY